MKNNVFIALLGLVLFSCDKDKDNYQEEVASYPFTKEGSLTLENSDGQAPKTIEIEFAENRAETEKGLMDRDSLQENQGMLFIFDQPKKQTFYMKNTRIPLDLIYISSDSVVVDVQQGVPYKLETIPSDTLSQFVLEVNKGMAQKWGVKENQTKVSWSKN